MSDSSQVSGEDVVDASNFGVKKKHLVVICRR